MSKVPQVGADEWVAREEHRREYLPSWLGRAQRQAERIGWWPRLAVAGLAAAALPLVGLGGFQLQVGIDALVVALLAVGLNIMVGWTGLLDLGYVAFFGCGAYGFALVSSGQVGPNGIHLPSYLSIPLVMLATAALGLLVGLPARRSSSSPTTSRRPRWAGPTGSSGSTRSAFSATRSPPTPGTTSCWWSCSCSPWRCCGCSNSRAPGGPGGRCARIPWRPGP